MQQSARMQGPVQSRTSAMMLAAPRRWRLPTQQLLGQPKTRLATARSGAPERSSSNTTGSAAADRSTTSTRAAAEAPSMPSTTSTPSGPSCSAVSPSAAALAGLSYNQQYEILFKARPLNTKMVVPKPDPKAQKQEPGATQVFGTELYAVKRRPQFWERSWNKTDLAYGAFLGGMHLLALAAPFTFSWPMVGLFLATYFVSGCLGITLSYHRQLSHRSFQTPKWLEYVLAYCGVLAVQGDPIEWASSHRYHHLHCDTPLDPHSPYEGFLWCHMGWLLDNEATMERVQKRDNAADLESQPFYRWLRDTFMWHVVAQFAVLYLLGGFPAMVWGGALRMVWVYHITWAVNSVTHVWGTQTYNTGDLSRNNWPIGILAWGEGWHNNHHAFEFSARHGLEPHQVDVTWGIIWALQKLGLATNVKLPTEKQKAKLAFPSAQPLSG